MLNIMKKTLIIILSLASILLPMDPPTKENDPISIITVLDKNIKYFSNSIAALNNRIISAESRESLENQLETEKSNLQKLLDLNQSFKQQWEDHSENWREKEKIREKKFEDQLDRTNTEIGKALQGNIDEYYERLDQAINEAVSRAKKQTLKEFGITVKSLDLLTKKSNRMLPREDDGKVEIAKLLDPTVNDLTTIVDTLNTEYKPEIERLNKEIARLELEKKELEIERYRINRIGYRICAGFVVFMISTTCILKYFYPQGLFQ